MHKMSVFKVASELGLVLQLSDLQKLQEVLQGAYMQGVYSARQGYKMLCQIQGEEGVWYDVPESVFNDSLEPKRIVYERV